MENINKLEIVPGEVYEIGADKVPVIPKWSVKDDATLWQKVNKLAHSTFDRSKFTVVGSPKITDDGVASGFSKNKYLTIPAISISKTNNIKIKIRHKIFTSSLGSGENDFFISTGNHNVVNAINLMVHGTNQKIVAWIGGVSKESVQSLTLGKEYDFVYETLNGQFRLSATEVGTSTTIATDWGIIPDNFLSNATMYIGNCYNGTAFYGFGSIDLKYFSITVDGVEVFSGNKTGIDTIKPVYYTVVGTPTISADGIASGFSSSNAIKTTTFQPTATQSWKIECQFNSGDLVSTNTGRYILGFNGGSGNSAVLFQQGTNALAIVLRTENGVSPFFSLGYNSALSNTNYKMILESDGNYTYTAKILSSDGTVLAEKSETNSTALNFPNQTLNLGYNGWNYFTGSIDLNAFKIYVDGNLVYQPCLKIPYTEGVNNNKIVDSLYRDRVKDLFEQVGYNGYYTIGEDDFTLPSNKWSDVIEHKENGLTVAEQRVDQTLTIRGACEQGVDVNLPMEFFSADSYAVFGVGTTGTNTASKFTPAADGNYIAIGKGKV